ncbi:hypothetical protein [Sanguibacter sp. Z1732]
MRKGYEGRRGRTWLSLTPAGVAAYRRYLEVLTSITTA